MRSIVLFLAVCCLSFMAYAQPAGPNNSINVADGGGGQIAEPWTNPNLARTQNDIYTSISTTTKNLRTNYLSASSFGFAIPSGSTINGIIVEIDRYTSSGVGNVNDARIRIIDASGTIIAGSDKSAGALWPTTDTDTYESYGGAADLWSITDWTPAKINNSNFGVAIQAQTDNGNVTFNLFVDEIRITVHYTVSGASRYAVATGNWNSTGSWSATAGGAPGASVPTASNDVFIGGGFTITNDINTAACNSLTIGTTEAIPTGNLSFNNNARDIAVGPGGINITADGDVLGVFTPTITNAGDLTLNKVLTNRDFTLEMNGTSSLIISGTGSLGNLSVQTSSSNTGTLTVSNAISGPNNSLINASTGYLIFSGSTSSNVNTSTVGNTMEFAQVLPAGIFNISAVSLSYYNLVISGDATRRYGSDLTVNNNLTITANGVLNNSVNRDMAIYGNWTNNNGAAGFLPGSGIVTFFGGNAQSITNAAGQSFFHIVVSKTPGTTLTANNNIVVTSRLTMTDGIFDTGSNTLTGAGAITFNGGELQLGATGVTVPQLTGTYNINAGTITYDGAGAQTIRSTTSVPALSAYVNVQFTGSGTKSLSGAILVNNNLTIGGTATLDVTGSNFGINLKGNWTNTSTFAAQGGTVSLTGTSAQTITRAAGENFFNLTVNNTIAGSAIVLGSPVAVSNTLTLTDGYVLTTNTNLLTLGAAATVAGVSDASHINGPVAKVSTSATQFNFPVGDGSNYMVAAVTPTTTVNTTFVAQYVVGEQTQGSAIDVATLDHLSSQDSWIIQRTSGTADAAVTLSWEYVANPEVDNLPELRVAQWDGVQWTSRGNVATTGAPAAGTIRSNTVTDFTQPYFALGSSTTNNPLSINRFFRVAAGAWDAANVWSFSAAGPATAPAPTATKNAIILPGNTVTISDASAGQAVVSVLSLRVQGTITMSNGFARDVEINVGTGGMILETAANFTGTDDDKIHMSGDISLGNAAPLSHTLLQTDFSSQGNTISGTGSLPYLNVDDNNQIFTGSTSYVTLLVPNSATNNGTITITGSLSGAGTLTNASTGTVIWTGTSISDNVINATAVGNSIILTNNTGGNINLSDVVEVNTYHNLTLGGANAFTQTTNLAINGNLTIGVGSVFNNASNNRTLSIGGNWTNNNGTGGFLEGTNIITFNGNTAQTIFISSGTEFFDEMTVNNTSSTGVTLAGPVRVVTDLVLTDGIVYTDNTNMIQLLGTASSNGNSYVDGPVHKYGVGAFIFPVGDAGVYARLGMENVANFGANTVFSCEYIHTAYSNTTDKDAAVTTVSTVEHWILNRVVDTGNDASCRVRLYWQDQSASGITDLADLRVGHFYNPGAGLRWYNFGGTTTDNGNGSGDIISTTTFTSFSPITFVSEFGFNALPIELTSFTAVATPHGVQLNWETATEINNDYFEIQRFVDAEQVDSIGLVNGQGNSFEATRYAFLDDMPLLGKLYYRLKQVDFDGKYSYSPIVFVDVTTLALPNPIIFPNPGTGSELNFRSAPAGEPVRITIFNSKGSLVTTAIHQTERGATLNQWDLTARLAPGMYLVRFEYTTGYTVVRKWVVK